MAFASDVIQYVAVILVQTRKVKASMSKVAFASFTAFFVVVIAILLWLGGERKREIEPLTLHHDHLAEVSPEPLPRRQTVTPNIRPISSSPYMGEQAVDVPLIPQPFVGISGHVYDSTNAPVIGAAVRVLSRAVIGNNQEIAQTIAECLSEIDGSYRIALDSLVQVVNGQEVRVEAKTGVAAASSSLFVVSQSGNPGIDLVLQEAQKISGKVVVLDHNNQEIRGSQASEIYKTLTASVLCKGANSWLGPGVETIVINSEGRFSVSLSGYDSFTRLLNNDQVKFQLALSHSPEEPCQISGFETMTLRHQKPEFKTALIAEKTVAFGVALEFVLVLEPCTAITGFFCKFSGGSSDCLGSGYNVTFFNNESYPVGTLNREGVISREGALVSFAPGETKVTLLEFWKDDGKSVVVFHPQFTCRSLKEGQRLQEAVANDRDVAQGDELFAEEMELLIEGQPVKNAEVSLLKSTAQAAMTLRTAKTDSNGIVKFSPIRRALIGTTIEIQAIQKGEQLRVLSGRVDMPVQGARGVVRVELTP